MPAAGEGVQSIERSARVLRAIADGGSAGLRLVDVVSATELHKTTVHRILTTLEGLGWTEQDEVTGHYRIGLEIVGLGMAGFDRHHLLGLADEHLERIVALTEDTAYLQVRVGNQALCVDRLAGAFPIRALTLGIGDRRPLGVGAGSLALLAWSPPEDAARAISATVTSDYPLFRDPGRLREMAASAREQGYAENSGLIVPGAEGIGVPVLDASGFAIAAISVAAITSRFEGTRRQQIVAWLKEEASLLSMRLREVKPTISAADVRRLLPDAG